MALTTISYNARGYTTKRISQVRADKGTGHGVNAVLSLPAGKYNVFLHGMMSITEGYSEPSISSVDFFVGLNVGGDNPNFSVVPNRNWQQLTFFKKLQHYQCLGGTELDLTLSTNTVEARVGLRDTASPLYEGEGYDDTTILVFQIAVSVTRKIVD